MRWKRVSLADTAPSSTNELMIGWERRHGITAKKMISTASSANGTATDASASLSKC
jgi:hypothetical protein